MEDIPQEIPVRLRGRIRADLLRVHSKFLELAGPKNVAEGRKCLGECYDVYTKILHGAGWPLTEALLVESIPAWVLQWAMAREWRLTRYAASEDSLMAGIRWVLRGRIAYWQAEALAAAISETAAPEADPAEERAQRENLLASARVGLLMKDIAHKIGVGRTTIYKWLEDPGKVRPEKAAAIVSGLRKIVAEK